MKKTINGIHIGSYVTKRDRTTLHVYRTGIMRAYGKDVVKCEQAITSLAKQCSKKGYKLHPKTFKTLHRGYSGKLPIRIWPQNFYQAVQSTLEYDATYELELHDCVVIRHKSSAIGAQVWRNGRFRIFGCKTEEEALNLRTVLMNLALIAFEESKEALQDDPEPSGLESAFRS